MHARSSWARLVAREVYAHAFHASLAQVEGHTCLSAAELEAVPTASLLLQHRAAAEVSAEVRLPRRQSWWEVRRGQRGVVCLAFGERLAAARRAVEGRLQDSLWLCGH